MTSTEDGLRTVGNATGARARLYGGGAAFALDHPPSGGSVFAVIDPLTTEDIDALIGPATPHFAYQLAARVREAIADLAVGDPVRAYAEERLAMLAGLGLASSKAADSALESRRRLGWETIPSSAPASAPLPRRES
jgi:hypothetical protein